MLPVVDVLMPVYNHEKYIAQSIEGVLSQLTDFKFRLLIGDDKSTDKSREIIEKYAQLYPDIIHPVFQEKNLGPAKNCAVVFSLVSAKYIAFCEGDDYWTDTGKLQKQFDFLEANPDFNICFTRSEALDDNGMMVDGLFPEITKDEFSIEDIIMTEMVFIPTATLFFRNVLPKPMPQFYVNALSGDVAIHLLACDKGKIKCLPGLTSVYRYHPSSHSKIDRVVREGDKRLFMLFEAANEYFEYRHDAVIRRRLSQMSKTKLIFGSKGLKGWSKLKYVMQNVPDYFKYSDTKNIKEMLYYATILFFPSLLKLKK